MQVGIGLKDFFVGIHLFQSKVQKHYLAIEHREWTGR